MSTDPQTDVLLIVDDEPALRELVCRVAESVGYRCLEAADGAEALRVFAAHREKIGGIITDVNMPVMDGIAFIKALREQAPLMKVAISSGSLADAEHRVALSLGVCAVLPKPYTATQLATCVRAMME
jgi:CheY-like chemotaxis protein